MGTVKKDGQPLAGAWVNVSKVNGEKQWFNAQTDENGKYKLDLPDGEYQIDDVWVESESKLYPVAVSFTVQDDVVANPEGLNLDLTEKGPNVNGYCHERWTAGFRCLGKCRTVNGEKQWFNGKQMKTESISLTYQMESIKLREVWIGSESKWYPSAVSFTVQNGK